MSLTNRAISSSFRLHVGKIRRVGIALPLVTWRSEPRPNARFSYGRMRRSDSGRAVPCGGKSNPATSGHPVIALSSGRDNPNTWRFAHGDQTSPIAPINLYARRCAARLSRACPRPGEDRPARQGRVGLPSGLLAASDKACQRPPGSNQQVTRHQQQCASHGFHAGRVSAHGGNQ